MATIKYIQGSDIRIYKDGRYLGTLTQASEETTQNVIDKQYIGDDETVSIGTTKEYGGTLTRDMNDDIWAETIIGRITSTKMSVANYTDPADTLRGTVDNVTNEDISFTTPTNTGLVLQYVSFNAKKIGSFAGGLDIEVWEGLAGSGTLKATLSCEAGLIPTADNEYLTAHLDEAAEVALTSNVAHTIRFTAGGAPTGSVELYGNSTDTDPYFAVGYEMSELESADYVIDIAFPLADGSEFVMRDTQITFISDSINLSAGDLVSEALGWKAKKREIL